MIIGFGINNELFLSFELDDCISHKDKREFLLVLKCQSLLDHIQMNE
jgi:hypothetical protein